MNGPDPALVRQKLMKWDGYLRDFSLPAWEELPQLELYMDQVVSLINSYLAYLPKEEGTNLVVTKAAVNNYVRKRIMPPPVKKRYGRVHLAYLILICDLKQCFSIADVQRLLPRIWRKRRSGGSMTAMSCGTGRRRCSLSGRCGSAPETFLPKPPPGSRRWRIS